MHSKVVGAFRKFRVAFRDPDDPIQVPTTTVEFVESFVGDLSTISGSGRLYEY